MMSKYIDTDYEEPNCMACMNQDECDGKNCGPEHAWVRYCRYKDEDVATLNKMHIIN